MVFVQSALTDFIRTQQADASDNVIYHVKLVLTPTHLPVGVASKDQHSSRTHAFKKLLVTLTIAVRIVVKETIMYS